MSLYVMPYEGREDGPKAMVLLLPVRGQRWHHLVCFGRLSHYFEDGGCEHTDVMQATLTEYGKKVVKVKPFGDGKYVPKRPRRRRA